MRYGMKWMAVAAAVLVAGCGAMSEDMAMGAGAGGYGDPWSGGGSGAGGGGGTGPSQGDGDWQAGEQYTSYGENDFTDPAEDALCTFGVDVDTASYTIMRRDVRGSALPVSDGVRVEEYLNFFTYGYEPPAADGNEAFAVHLDAAPSPFGEGLQLLRVGIKGKEIAAAERPAANLVFLVDVSGSMQDQNKLPLVKQTLRLLLDQLRPTDTVGLVTYASNPGVALPPTPASERETILEAINRLEAGGSTNGEGGIRTAYDLAEEHMVEGGINRVVLCTDGDFNVGVTGPALTELIEEFRDRGIYLTTLGFGAGNYNDSTMEQLADKGNGNYAYVDDAAEADRVVRRDLLGTMVVIAQDVKIQVEINPEAVARYRLIGYENRAIDDDEFEDPTVDTGDIGSGHDVTALIELELKESVHEPGTIPAGVATVKLRYKVPGFSDDIPFEKSIDASQFAGSFDAASDDFRLAAAVAEYGEILRRSKHSEGARFDDVMEIAASATQDQPDRLEFLELVDLASGIWEARFGTR